MTTKATQYVFVGYSSKPVIDTFITTWQTDNLGLSADNEITIPTNGIGYNYYVSWTEVGNLSNSGIEDPLTGDATIGFSSAGTYQISISGTFPSIFFNRSKDRFKLISIDQWGSNEWVTMESVFYGCSNMTVSATDTPNLCHRFF